MRHRILATIAICWALGACLDSAKSAEPIPPKTLMADCGSLLFADDLSQPLADRWRIAKGKWEVAQGAVQVSEVTADKHAAVARHPAEYANAVFECSFKLDGAKLTTLSVNGAKGHICRVLISPKQLKIQKDDSDHQGPDKVAVLGVQEISLADGKWHTIVVELVGGELLAKVDDRPALFGQHVAIDVPKGDFGITVGGEHASFKNFRVWNASPKADWPALKAKLAAGK